jgi:hypothetical protein
MEQVNYLNHLYTINVFWGDRWQIYHRLAELGITCKCSTAKPLEVSIETPTAALQVWSVARQQIVDRSYMVSWLELCFKQNYQQVLEDLLYGY